MVSYLYLQRTETLFCAGSPLLQSSSVKTLSSASMVIHVRQKRHFQGYFLTIHSSRPRSFDNRAAILVFRHMLATAIMNKESETTSECAPFETYTIAAIKQALSDENTRSKPTKPCSMTPDRMVRLFL